jgi:DNA-binding NtrC family response regulator
VAAQEAAQLLQAPWPGNVRQLINVLRNVVVLNQGPVVTPEMLPPDLLAEHPKTAVEQPRDVALSALGTLAGRTLAEIERLAIEDALERHGGSVPKAARELDVSASTIYRKLDAWSKAESSA